MSNQNVFNQLCQLLEQQQARFRIVKHPQAGRSEEVARIRGTELGQGAKALVCHIKGNGVKQYVLAVLPADQLANLGSLAQQMGALKASLASPKEVELLTHCVFGAIPPFSFHPELMLIADPMLFERYDELAFNAGSLQHSIILNSKDYQRIAKPNLLAFRRQSE